MHEAGKDSTVSRRDGLKRSRFIKELAKSEKIGMGGRLGKGLESVIFQADLLLSDLEEENGNFIEKQRESLKGYFKGVSEDEIRQSYTKGLESFLKQQYRLVRKISPNELSQFQDQEYLKDTIQDYSFDFFLSLHTAKRLNLSPLKALEIAALSYRCNPLDLLKLVKQFPDFELGVTIIPTVLSYVDPESFLRKAQQIIPKLKEQFPGFETWIIVKAAVGHPSDPEGHISSRLKR